MIFLVRIDVEGATPKPGLELPAGYTISPRDLAHHIQDRYDFPVIVARIDLGEPVEVDFADGSTVTFGQPE